MGEMLQEQSLSDLPETSEDKELLRNALALGAVAVRGGLNRSVNA